MRKTSSARGVSRSSPKAIPLGDYLRFMGHRAGPAARPRRHARRARPRRRATKSVPPARHAAGAGAVVAARCGLAQGAARHPRRGRPRGERNRRRHPEGDGRPRRCGAGGPRRPRPAHRLPGEHADKLPFVAAALQAYWTRLAVQLGNAALAPLDVPGVCPCCGALPSVSVIGSSAEFSGMRFLHCSLCNTEWHLTRASCSACDAGESAVAYQHIEGDKGLVQAETCDIVQVLPQGRAPRQGCRRQPVADDLGHAGPRHPGQRVRLLPQRPQPPAGAGRDDALRFPSPPPSMRASAGSARGSLPCPHGRA